ncbi:MAG TPA: hypothetical protein VFW98_07275 [Gemmatimonadaceae bacterium]|nr:hypothetical protein [Gemmatimonadaceae bacterium]
MRRGAGIRAGPLDQCRDLTQLAIAFRRSTTQHVFRGQGNDALESALARRHCLNGRELDVLGEALYAMVMAVSTDRVDIEQVAGWLRSRL